MTILATVAFSAIGALVGFKTILTESIEKPFAFEYISYAGNSPEQAASAVDVIEHKLFVEEFPSRSCRPSCALTNEPRATKR